MHHRPVFPVDTIPAGHPLLNSGGLGQPGGIGAGSTFPDGYALNWFWWDMETLSNSAELLTSQARVSSMPAANAFYAYGHPFSWSANTGTEIANGISMFFMRTESKTYYSFYILDRPWDGSGGEYKMSLTASAPIITPNPDYSEITPHDDYVFTRGDVPGRPSAVPWNGVNSTMGQIPLMLRDDPWNRYTYNQTTGKANFHWYWLECCTDGMVLGPLPTADRESMFYNLTWEGDCSNMNGLEQGTRINQWQPFYKGGSWIHYDVPMYQNCFETKGIQMSARSCDEWCPTFDNCGECTAQWDCQWTGTSCTHIPGPDSQRAFYTSGTGFHNNRGCSECAAITDSHTCIHAKGCGWAPFEKQCVSGTPDFPSGEYTVVQWEPPVHCYSVSWNEKRAFADAGQFSEKSRVIPVTQYPAGHPKLNQPPPCGTVVPSATSDPLAYHNDFLWGPSPGNSYATNYHSYGPPGILTNNGRRLHGDDDDGLRRPFPHPSNALDSGIPAVDYWSRFGATQCDDSSIAVTSGAEVFYAYNYPNAFSSNSGLEKSGSVTAVLVVDSNDNVYMIMAIDAAHDGSGGHLALDFATTGAIGHASDPVKFMGPPHDSGPAGVPAGDSRDGYIVNEWLQQRASVSFGWDSCCSDGMIFGPLPATAWSLNMQVNAQDTRGLDDFRVGTYDSGKNAIGYLTLPIKKTTAAFGGVQLDGLDCTDWCQQYNNRGNTQQSCSACHKDSACKFAPNNGGCIAAAAYVYDYGCARPAFPLITKLTARGDQAAIRERANDGYNSTVVLRVTLDRVDMSCPCDTVYKISVAIYSQAMAPLAVIEDVTPRTDHPHTFIDLPDIEGHSSFITHTWLCMKQGTIYRDACSPLKMDNYTLPA